MPAPIRAELHSALLEIRQAAENLKGYEPELVDRLQTTIRAHVAAIGRVDDLPADRRTACARISAQCAVVIDCIERARQYPAQIMARADVLDRTGILAKMIRDLLARLGGPPAR